MCRSAAGIVAAGSVATPWSVRPETASHPTPRAPALAGIVAHAGPASGAGQLWPPPDHRSHAERAIPVTSVAAGTRPAAMDCGPAGAKPGKAGSWIATARPRAAMIHDNEHRSGISPGTQAPWFRRRAWGRGATPLSTWLPTWCGSASTWASPSWPHSVRRRLLASESEFCLPWTVHVDNLPVAFGNALRVKGSTGNYLPCDRQRGHTDAVRLQVSAEHCRGRPERRLAEGNSRKGRDRVVGEPAPGDENGPETGGPHGRGGHLRRRRWR